MADFVKRIAHNLANTDPGRNSRVNRWEMVDPDQGGHVTPIKNNGQELPEITMMSDLLTIMANIRSRRASASSLILALLVLAATLILPSAAIAAPIGAGGQSLNLNPAGGKDPPITFSFNLGGLIGSGTLDATNMGNGIYQANTGTLTMGPTSSADAGNTYCLVPATVALPNFTFSPSGAFIFDDLISPGANPAFPTTGGLLFSNNYGACVLPAGGVLHEINIWATVPGTPGLSFYDFSQGTYLPDYPNSPAPLPGDFFSATAVTTTYSYSGNGFKLFQCATSPTTDCATPGPNNQYTTTNSVTVALQLAGKLCTTAPGTCSTVPVNILCSNGNPNANFVSMTVNDGIHTITVSNPVCNGPATATAWLATDNNGNITAWYVDATGGGDSEWDIHTLNDPALLIYGHCPTCTATVNNAQVTVQDYGQYYTPGGTLFYGYNLSSPGSFTPGYNGGSTTAGSCSAPQNCNLVPGNTFTIKLAPGAVIPPGTVLTEQECVVLADPRGANCGATNGHPPRSLSIATDLAQQCPGFGNEVIPDYICGASGQSQTGFALILGNAEQLDTFNGTYGDSELDVEKVPGLAGFSTNPTCPKAPLNGRPSATGLVGTRSNSLVEEQTPEMTFQGQPLLIDMTSACDPPHTNHGPGLTVEGIGFKLRTNDPTVRNRLTDAQNLLVLANYKFINLDVVMILTKFPTTDSTRKNLQSCINKSQVLLNSGPSHYACAAEQIYRCDQIVEGPNAPSFTDFGPSTSPLRLPDPWGDVVRRLGNLYYTINTRINGTFPNSDWPLSADPNLGSCP
jgi:hypothetical protein